MGRLKKKGLDHFQIDCDQEDDLDLVEAKHGIAGYGTVVKLWQKIYKFEGYYAEWEEKHQHLFAKKIGVTFEFLQAVLETCFDEDLFHLGLYEKYRILTGSGPQKRWKEIVTNAKRKDTKIEFIHDISLFTPEEIIKTPEVSTQSKVKDSKVKKSKVNVSPDSGGEEVKDLVWPKLVESWFVFYEKKVGEKPSFEGRITSDFKNLVGMLEKKVLAKKNIWDVDTAGGHFTKFLEVAYHDPWLSKNFLISNLLTQFDKIIANGKNGTPIERTSTGTVKTVNVPEGVRRTL